MPLLFDARDGGRAAAHERVHNDHIFGQDANYPAHDIYGHLTRVYLAVLVFAHVLHLIQFPPIVEHPAFVSFGYALSNPLVFGVLVRLLDLGEVRLDTEEGDVAVLARCVGVIDPCHNPIRKLTDLEGELVECFGVVYHDHRQIDADVLQPLEVLALFFVVVVLVVVVAYIEGRVCHDAELMTLRQHPHPFEAVHVIYFVYLHILKR